MIAALQGQEGAIEILDYRPHMTFVGYTSIDGIGVEYKTDIENIDAQILGTSPCVLWSIFRSVIR